MDNSEQTKKGIWFNWKKWLNYKSVVKQLPFFLFLTVLCLIYIYNGLEADRKARDINKLSSEIKELQYEYKSYKSAVMYKTKQSELVKAVSARGLKEVTESPVILLQKDTLNKQKIEQ